jgi:prephenate dehydrogenase
VSSRITVAIFGVGLIGGSIGMALRQRGLAQQVVGLGRDDARLNLARKSGAITASTTQVEEAAKSADLVVICTPVKFLFEHVQMVTQHCSPTTLITDAGSTKLNLVQQVEAELPSANFVGSHPLAGSDRSGVEHASGDLFEGRTVVVTPTEASPEHSVTQLTDFWESLGAHVVRMLPAQHDRALARTSHLPHVLASALAALTREDELRLTAGGWLDTTRIAAADAELWQQILLDNKQNVAAEIGNLCQKLNEFKSALDGNDSETIKRLLAAGKQRRDAVGS